MSSMNFGETDASRLVRVQEFVYERRPAIKKIIQKHGNESLLRYALGYYEPLSGQLTQRQQELIDAIKQYTQTKLGPAVADRVSQRLRRYYVASTADHMGPVVHPFFLSSNLLSALPQIVRPQADLHSVVVFACASVSLENSSFPRGLVYHSKNSDTEQKLPFFSTHIRPSIISHLPAYGQDEMRKVKKSLGASARLGQITKAEAEFLKSLLDEVYNQPEIMALPSFSDQVTQTNYRLWQKYFPAGVTAPELIYLELESVVTEILLKHHMQADTVIHRLLFSPESWPWLDRFAGIAGAFSQTDHSGTFMFWGVPPGARRRVRMIKHGNHLVCEDGSYKIELTAPAIGAALRRHEIIPGVLLDFIVLACYYGLKCQGGFSQVNYLTEIKAAYNDIISKLGYPKSEFSQVITSELCGDIIAVFLQGLKGQLLPATGIDWLMHHGAKTWEIFTAQCQALTLAETLNPVMPEFYRILYTEKERYPELASLTAADIMQATGLLKKIIPGLTCA